MLKQLLAQSASFVAFIQELNLGKNYPQLDVEAHPEGDAFALSFLVECYIEQGRQYCRTLVADFSQRDGDISCKVKFVQRINAVLTDSVLIYGKDGDQASSAAFFESSACDWLIRQSKVEESMFGLKQLMAICDAAHQFKFDAPIKETSMKILIIGGTESLSQTARAALVQAGIHVEVTDVESLDVAINVNGGVIQDIIANVPMSATVVDFDEADDDEQRRIERWVTLKENMPFVLA